MFLNMLNEHEGQNFLELASIAMNVDGVVQESERTVFKTYRKELDLPNYKICNREYEDVVRAFQGSTKRIKKAVIIELAGVLDADEKIDSSEEAWIMKLGSDWGFRDAEMRKMIRWTQDFNDLLKEALDYINKR